jgi:protein kinase-like protein
MFPIGVTLQQGRWTITEWLAGEQARGRYRVRAAGGGRGLLTLAPTQKRTTAELYGRFTSVALGVAELRYVGPLETNAGRYDGLIEDEPAGTPLAERTIDAPIALVASLCELVARAHVTGFVAAGLRPELVYVDDEERVTAVAPRCEPFLFTAGTSSSGVLHCFDHYFAAPEVLRTKPPPLTGAADVFSLTAILARLVTGEHPFDGDDATTQLFSITGNRRRPWRGPEGLGALVDRGLAPDPQRRPSARELGQALAVIA